MTRPETKYEIEIVEAFSLLSMNEGDLIMVTMGFKGRNRRDHSLLLEMVTARLGFTDVVKRNRKVPVPRESAFVLGAQSRDDFECGLEIHPFNRLIIREGLRVVMRKPGTRQLYLSDGLVAEIALHRACSLVDA